MAATISITVNGEARDIPAPATVADLLARIGLDTRKVAVERNLEIVPRSHLWRDAGWRPATSWRSCISSAEAEPWTEHRRRDRSDDTWTVAGRASAPA